MPENKPRGFLILPVSVLCLKFAAKGGNGLVKQNNYVRLEFYAKDCNISSARLAAASFGAELGFSFSDLEEIKVAVSEAVSNAMIHGYCGDESRLV